MKKQLKLASNLSYGFLGLNLGIFEGLICREANSKYSTAISNPPTNLTIVYGRNYSAGTVGWKQFLNID